MNAFLIFCFHYYTLYGSKQALKQVFLNFIQLLPHVFIQFSTPEYLITKG